MHFQSLNYRRIKLIIFRLRCTWYSELLWNNQQLFSSANSFEWHSTNRFSKLGRIKCWLMLNIIRSTRRRHYNYRSRSQNFLNISHFELYSLQLCSVMVSYRIRCKLACLRLNSKRTAFVLRRKSARLSHYFYFAFDIFVSNFSRFSN